MAAINEDNKEDLTAKTVLDDSSSIYQERKQIVYKDLSFKEKVKYIFQYHKGIIISIPIIIILIFTLIIPAITKVNPTFYMTFFNQYNSEASYDNMEKYCSDVTNTPLKEVLITDYKADTAQDYTLSMVIATRLAAKEFDVLIADKDTANELIAPSGNLISFKEFLPEDMYKKLEDKMIMVKDVNDNTCPYLIDISNTDFISDNKYTIKDATLSIAVNAPHPEKCIEIIKKIFKL